MAAKDLKQAAISQLGHSEARENLVRRRKAMAEHPSSAGVAMRKIDKSWQFWLKNSTDEDLAVWLEPWADSFDLAPLSEVSFRLESDKDVPLGLRLDQAPGCVVVYVEVGTRIHVAIDGVAQESRSATIACPEWTTEEYAKLHSFD